MVHSRFNHRSPNQLAIVPLRLTPLMKKRLTRRAQEMIARSLPHFPELSGKMITLGYTRRHLGSASIIYHRGKIARLIIRLKVRKLTYQTIGHELFCDDPPTYIKMPRIMRERWLDYAEAVRRLCIAAIEKRSTQRLYIQWLETETAKLTKALPRQKTIAAQLFLPFEDLQIKQSE